MNLHIGDPAPDFRASLETGAPVQLSDYRGQKLVLFFYPKDNTPGCTAESCNLRDHYQELRQAGFELLGVSPDSAKSHLNFISKFELPFHLVVDPEKNMLKAYGAWGEKKMYGKTYEGVLRSTVVIDEAGRIAHLIDKVDTKNHAAQILEWFRSR